MNELTTLPPPTLEIIDGVPTAQNFHVSYIFRRQPQAVRIPKIQMSLLSPQLSE